MDKGNYRGGVPVGGNQQKSVLVPSKAYGSNDSGRHRHQMRPSTSQNQLKPSLIQHSHAPLSSLRNTNSSKDE